MFFLSPILAFFDTKFYVSQLKQGLLKPFGFLVYLFIIASILMFFILIMKLTPITSDFIGKMAEYTPHIIVKDGIANVNDNQKYVIEPKELEGYKLVFDTSTEEPAYPTQLLKENIIFYMNKSTIYLTTEGRFENRVLPKNLNIEVSKEIVLSNQKMLTDIIVKFITAIMILLQLIKLPFMILIGWIVAICVDSYLNTKCPKKDLLIMSIYMQAPIMFLYLIELSLPITSSATILVYIVAFIIYAHFILVKRAELLDYNKVGDTNDTQN